MNRIALFSLVTFLAVAVHAGQPDSSPKFTPTIALAQKTEPKTEPKAEPPPIVRITPEKIVGSLREVLVIEATGKGKVEFVWDDKVFNAKQTGKLLSAVALKEGDFVIRCIGYAEEKTDHIQVSIGQIDPRPDPPKPVPPPTPGDVASQLVAITGKLDTIIALLKSNPPPIDSFVKQLQAAYALETSPAKATEAGTMALVYRQTQLSLNAGGFSHWTVFDYIASQEKKVGTLDKLPGVHAVVKAELLRTLPNDPSLKIDAAGRELADKVLGGIARAIEELQVGPMPPPPPPPPPPSPAPIPVPGYRVLFVEESSLRGQLTPGQFNTMFGKASRDWLDANCVKENNQPGYRIYDKDQSSAGDLKVWQDAMARPRTSVPWVIISNGITGYEGPLPALETESQALLQKYLPSKRSK